MSSPTIGIKILSGRNHKKALLLSAIHHSPRPATAILRCNLTNSAEKKETSEQIPAFAHLIISGGIESLMEDECGMNKPPESSPGICFSEPFSQSTAAYQPQVQVDQCPTI